MINPHLIEGHAIVSFSGGRTSAFMLWHIIQAHGGTLPDDVKVCFANTGKEMPETLDFVRDCADRWGVEIVWLERAPKGGEMRFLRVDHATASRNGEPFMQLIREKQYLPNPVTRFCTSELKIRVMRDYARSLGWDNWTNVIGLRADEMHRVAKARNNKDPWDNAIPLATAGVTKADVSAFWSRQNFDLRLPNIGGKTPLGNCDLCFLKGASNRISIIRQHPELARWWIEAEAGAMASKPDGARFRKNAPPYKELARFAANQIDMFDDEDLTECACTD